MSKAAHLSTVMSAAGLVQEHALPPRLRATATVITNWNEAVNNGYFQSYPNAANAPLANANFWGMVTRHNELYCEQTISAFSHQSQSDTYSFRRYLQNGTWTAWFRLRLSQIEIEALFANRQIEIEALFANSLLRSGGPGQKMTGPLYGIDGPASSFVSEWCAANSYNLALTVGNDLSLQGFIFMNGSTRAEEGGPNAMTIRNYHGSLRLGGTGGVIATTAFYTPANPLLRCSRGREWEIFSPGTFVAPLGQYEIQRGGFYTGGAIGPYGGTAVHVPLTGYYLISLRAYVNYSDWARLAVYRNATYLGLFVQWPSNPGYEGTLESSGIYYLNANDYLVYYAQLGNATVFTANGHTTISALFLG